MPLKIQRAHFNPDVQIVHSLEDLAKRIREDRGIDMHLSDPRLRQQINDSHEGETPIYLAASLGKADMVRQLMRNGADPCKGHQESGNSPLHIASVHGNIETANALLQSAPSLQALNQKNNDGKTPLHLATENGHAGVVGMLMKERNLDPTVIDGSGDSPLAVAAKKADVEMVRELLKHASAPRQLEWRGQEGQTVLSSAVLQNHADVLRTLIAAIRQNIPERTLEMLNCADNDGWTPFLLSVEKRDVAIMKLLTEAGADFKKDIQGKNAIHLAAHNGDVEIIQAFMGILESRKVNVEEYIDAYAQDGKSPLLAAARAGHHHVVELLAQAGADLHSSIKGVKKMGGTNAVYLAAQRGHIKVIETLVNILRKRQASEDDIKAYIDSIPEHGYTPLLATITHAEEDDTDIVNLLLELGADIRHGADGWTNSIHCAARFGKSEVIKVLVEAAGHDPNFIGERDGRGKTPLSLAAQNNRIEAIRTLLALDADGAAALLEAAQNDDVDTIRALFSAIEKEGQDELTAALNEGVPGAPARAALGDPRMARLFDEMAEKTDQALHAKLNANFIPVKRPVQITRLLHELASDAPRVELCAPLKITETKTIISLPKLVSQFGHICKLTALANLDLLYATNRGIPNIPLRKNRSGYYTSQTNEYHSGSATTSIREQAKKFNSRQGEVLQVDDLKAVAREMGYKVHTLAPGDLAQCRSEIADSLNKGAPLVTFFQVSPRPGQTRYGWPQSGRGEDVEHAALIVGIDTRLDTVDLAHWGQVFPGIPLMDLYRSMDDLAPTRQAEVYERTNLERSADKIKSYKKYELVRGRASGVMQDGNDVATDRVSIAPIGAGFKNCLLSILPDEAHERWGDSADLER